MPAQKSKNADSVRERWVQQRKLDTHGALPASSRGKHYALPSGSTDHKRITAHSIADNQTAGQSSTPRHSAAAAQANAASPVSGQNPEFQSAEVQDQKDMQGSKSSQDALQESPRQTEQATVQKPHRKISSAAKSQYSRYHVRYSALAEESAAAKGHEKLPIKEAPAASWVPFALFVGIALVLCAILLVVVHLNTGGAPLANTSAEFKMALVLLVVVVACGIGLGVVAQQITVRNQSMDAMEAFSSAAPRTAAALLCALVVWVAAMVLATY